MILSKELWALANDPILFSFAATLELLAEQAEQLEANLAIALEAHKRQHEDSDYCYMCDCHEHANNCPLGGE